MSHAKIKARMCSSDIRFVVSQRETSSQILLFVWIIFMFLFSYQNFLTSRTQRKNPQPTTLDEQFSHHQQPQPCLLHQHQPPQFLSSLAQLPHNPNLAKHQHLPSLIFSITVFSLCDLAKTEVAFYTFLTMLSACVLEQVFFWVGGVLLGL